MSHATLNDSEKHTCLGMDAALLGQVPKSNGIGGQSMAWAMPFELSAISGLSVSAQGGNVLVGGTSVVVPAFALTALPASTTSYLFITLGVSPAISSATSIPSGAIPLWEIVMGVSTALSASDLRVFVGIGSLSGPLSITMSDADFTPNTYQTMAEIILFSGALTADRNVVLPNTLNPVFIANQTTGGHNLVAKTSGGTGVTIANNKTACVFCDGTNTNRLTADI